MATEVKTVKCPLCGWHHSIEHKGSMRLQRGEVADQPKGEFVFGKFDLNETAFISIREARGRGGGLPEIDKITLEKAKNDPSYKNLITSLINRSYAILKILLPE